jgi:hypothetical protein
MELPNLQVHFFTVLGQQRCELVEYGSRGQSIVGWRVVNLLTMPLDLTEFFLKCPGLISEPILARWATPIEFGVVPPQR